MDVKWCEKCGGKFDADVNETCPHCVEEKPAPKKKSGKKTEPPIEEKPAQPGDPEPKEVAKPKE